MNEPYKTVEQNRINYRDILERSEVHLLEDQEYDLNIIIGFRGRYEFLDPILRVFQEAIDRHRNYKSDTKLFNSICLTFVEHDTEPKSKEQLLGKANYIFTPGNIVTSYSRSFAFNFGVKHSFKAKYYLLHDLDILVKLDFFERLEQNLTPEVKCMQPYSSRRVLYINPNWTQLFLDGNLDQNELEENRPWVSPPEHNGSKGGSLLISGDVFTAVGGFDPEIFWDYAAEDQMFWDKVQDLIGHMHYADDPHIDMLHMYHAPTCFSNPLESTMRSVWMCYKNLPIEQRLDFIKYKSELYVNA
jgi:hypothetical protein